jgi:hypothetical protein
VKIQSFVPVVLHLPPTRSPSSMRIQDPARGPRYSFEAVIRDLFGLMQRHSRQDSNSGRICFSIPPMTAVEHVLGWKGSAEPTTPRRGDTGGHPIGVALNRGWVDVDSVVRTGWDDRLGNTRGPSDERADWLLGRPTTAASSTSNDGPPGMPCRDQRSVGADLTPAYRQLRLGLGSR